MHAMNGIDFIKLIQIRFVCPVFVKPVVRHLIKFANYKF